LSCRLTVASRQDTPNEPGKWLNVRWHKAESVVDKAQSLGLGLVYFLTEVGMTRSKERRRRKKGYLPRHIYRELHCLQEEFLATLTPEERETFLAHVPPRALSPMERFRRLQENPPGDELLAKLAAFLKERGVSKAFRRYFRLEMGGDHHGK